MNRLIENKLRFLIRSEIKKHLKENVEFDINEFRNLSVQQQGNELERLVKKQFKTIHFVDWDTVNHMTKFYFIDEQESETTLKNALNHIKDVTHLSGRIGSYVEENESYPAIILWYN